MPTPSRRGFLATSLGALSAAALAGCRADGVNGPAAAREAGAAAPSAVPDTLFLTWQRDPTTTMTVQWLGRVGPLGPTADARVRYAAAADGPRPAGPWLGQWPTMRPYPKTDLTLFRAELTGLAPGTTYQLRVGPDNPAAPARTFRTMPAKATDTIHFVSGGDSGTNPHAVANNVRAAAQDPMFCVMGGDLAYENGTSANTAVEFVRNYSRHLVGRGGRLIPLVACLGNHEVDGGYNAPRGKAPFFFALFDGLFRDASYATLDFGDYLSLVLLDTGHVAKIPGAQTSWLEARLRERADHPNVMVVNHVPAYPSHRNMLGLPAKIPGAKYVPGTGEENRKHWVPLFERYRVPVVLEHHDHTFKRTKPLIGGMQAADGVLYLGDGSWGQIRAPQPPQKLSVMAATSQDYHLSLHRIEGEERFHLAMAESGRVMDVSRTGQRRRGWVAGGK